MKSEVQLLAKFVGAIEGKFFIPSYQRGYRWGENEVSRLLDDIYSTNSSNYCLQPVVVTKNADEYVLIDGQQRLTTIYLIYTFLNKTSNGFLPSPKFSLKYETRKNSEEYLKSIDSSRKDENIDFWFIANAYETITNWFSNKAASVLTKFNEYLDNNVKIIWYEVENNDPISLFTRLNIGKIPLTSAELIKAMFLCKGIEDKFDKKKEEISLQWDNIEKELHNNALWYFLTNQTEVNYQTRIDLVLDLISKKPTDNRDKYFTFFAFEKMKSNTSLDDIWSKIQHTFLILKDWYEDHELYHKIGYLVASKKCNLLQIFSDSENKTKDGFRSYLFEQIRNSIYNDRNYSELSYENSLDRKKISTLLLLFNVESVRQNGENTQWFPFDKFKFAKGKKVLWSIEHIHAQHSEGMRTQAVWKDWLRLHKKSVQSFSNKSSPLIDIGTLIVEIDSAIKKEILQREEFENIHKKVIEILSTRGNQEYLHSISNLALLKTDDNAALNNSTFDVKRSEIIQKDMKGAYIPFCTRNVFLKYYTPADKSQLHFWGHDDRVAYINAINNVLKEYLSEEISLVKETE